VIVSNPIVRASRNSLHWFWKAIDSCKFYRRKYFLYQCTAHDFKSGKKVNRKRKYKKLFSPLVYFVFLFLNVFFSVCCCQRHQSGCQNIKSIAVTTLAKLELNEQQWSNKNTIWWCHKLNDEKEEKVLTSNDHYLSFKYSSEGLYKSNSDFDFWQIVELYSFKVFKYLFDHSHAFQWQFFFKESGVEIFLDHFRSEWKRLRLRFKEKVN